MDNPSDEHLVKRIQDGDIPAFELFVKRYQKRVWFFVSKFVFSPQLVEEIVQDALFSFYRSIGKVDTTRTISTYLFTIAKHVAIDKLRQMKKTIRLDDIDLAYDDESLYEELIRFDKAQEVQKALKTLSTGEQRVFRLYFYDELSYEEISGVVGIPINTVRTNLRRAKAALRKIV